MSDAEKVEFSQAASELATTLNEVAQQKLSGREMRAQLIITATAMTKLLARYATLATAFRDEEMPTVDKVHAAIVGAPWAVLIAGEINDLQQQFYESFKKGGDA